MTEVLGLEDDDQDLVTSPKDVLSPNASVREIETFYERSRLRIVQERNDFFLPHVVDFIEDRAWGNLRPEYQRRLRWAEDKKSQLIESFIMNVPVPPVFLFEASLGEFEVMDGQQRLSAIVDFLQNRFELTGLKVWPPLNGRRFADLPATLKRALNRSKVSAITLSAEGVSSEASIDLRTQVFERLNTGGERLNAQEMRNSIYGGPFNGMLLELSGLPEFTEAWEIPSHADNIDADGTPSEHLRSNNLYKRMSDVEIVLRFYAFLDEDSIVGSVKRMLDQAMERGMSLSKERLQANRDLFVGSIMKARALLGDDAFRMPSRSNARMILSRPLFDAVMVAIARMEGQWPDLINTQASRAAMDAIKDPDSASYELLVGRANTAQAIKDRIRLVGGHASRDNPMSALDRALDTLGANLDEIRSTLRSRTDLIEGVAAVAAVVQPHLAALPQERSRFNAALTARRVSSDSLNRGLFLTAISAFEGFVKMMVSALVQRKSAGVGKFSDLPATFRQHYVVRASQVLSNVGSGTVKGIPYNFSHLQNSMGACFTDAGTPSLDGDVFTVLMGNPTWSRLTEVLKGIGIADPFDQGFGSSAPIRAWAKGTWRGNLSEAEKKLDELMATRNSIVHVAQPTTIVEQDVIDACEFFEAIARAFVAEMPGRL